MKALAAFLALMSASAFAGGVYYIDPVNGDDTWDGSCPIADRNALDEGARGLTGPRRTLVGADGLTTANQGDIVYLAEGTYAEEVFTDASYGRVRGRVKAGVSLIAVGARDKTIIKGAVDSAQTDASQKGCGPNAVSCLVMNTDSLVQGVTLTDGHVSDITKDGMMTNGGAVRGSGAYLVDCVITNNYGNRGGAVSGSMKAVGCRFYDNWTNNTGSDLYGGSAYNCFFGNVLRSNYNVYTGGPFVNCTFTGSGQFGRNFGAASFINCILAKTDGGNNKNAFSTCAFVGIVLSSDSTADGSNFSTTAADMLLDADDVPQWGSVATDRGSNDLYDAKFPPAAAVSAFKGLDALQKTRLIGGTIDLGAAEVDWRELPSTSGVDLTIVGRTVSAKRNYNSELCCLGFTFDGEKVLFPDDDAYVWSKTVADDLADHSLVLIYSKDWYVDAVNGNDANDGFTAKRAKKTLAGAMAISALTAGHVVHAAPGVYNEGVMAPQDTSCHCSNRVVLAKGVGLVADQGPDVTAIEGYKSKANANGTGPDAIRCVYGKDNTAYVLGFTLRNGSTPVKASAYDTTAGGGAVAGATAVDCVITNNTCGYRGGSACGGRFIRCRVWGNACADGSTGPDGYDCTFYGCVVAGNVCLGNFYNCTLQVVPWGSGTIKIYNSFIATSSSISTTANQFYDLRNVFSFGGFIWGSGSVTNEFCRFNVKTSETAVDTVTHRPAADSILVNAGDDELFLANFPAEFSFLREQDLLGGPRRVGGAVDVGVGEYDWRTLTSADGLAWSVADAPDGQVTLSVSRTFEGPQLCTGFTYGDERVVFDDHEKGYVWTKTMQPEELLASMLTPAYSGALKDFYVDAVNGDDANRGIHPHCARRTLAGAMAIPELANGCVVHAAPGVYDEGAMYGGSASNRVNLISGVGLVADQGPSVTVIKGAAAKGPDASAAGHGLDALRCAHVEYGAWLKGFTLTGGHTQNIPVDGKDYFECACGGAVACGTGGIVVDCDITGNSSAGRGPAVSAGIYIRCRFHGNSGNYPVYMVQWLIDSAAYGGDYVYSDGTILNCSLLSGSTWGTTPCPVYNSYVTADTGNKAYTNCILGCAYSAMKSTSATNLTCRFGLAADVDDIQRPKAGSPLVDTADKELYDAVIAQLVPDVARRLAQEPLDVAGGQRVYNAALDIGAGEYDWRGDFAKELRMRGVEVEEASANVTANAVKGLDLADGDTLKFKGVSLKVPGTVSFTVTVAGEGTVTAKVGETPLVADDSGVYSFAAEAGETEVVTVSFAGAGTATVSDVTLPLRGMLMLVR